MTDNRTTELLRKQLEERGLSCQTHYLHVSWRVGQKLYGAVDNLDGTLTVDNLTPEQAIAATLGSGALTADDVLNAVYKHGARWQAIADELNAELGSGTCRNIAGYASEFKCSECGAIWRIEDEECEPMLIVDGVIEYPRYCQNCGAKVVG